MKFKSFLVNEWQQFDHINIEFHEKVTILTGANGSGKTTILNLLARHYDWSINSLSIPKDEKSNGIWKYVTRLFMGIDKSEDKTIGSITYDNNTIANLLLPQKSTPTYSVLINGQQSIPCFFIPSHRSVFRYQQLSNIPTGKKNKKAAFSEVSQVTKQNYFGGNNQPSSYYMKDTLIGWAIKGYGVKSGDKYIMPKDVEQIRNYEGFQEILRKVLPKSLGFNEFEIRNMEIVFICNNGQDEFLLETSSGGISAIIDLAWQIYMYNVDENTEFTVIIDEIENHLHPTMQRSIINDFVDAFPNVTFIISTHSPLIVNSVKNSKIYALRYNQNKKVISEELDLHYKAKTANQILDEVLGVSFSMPLWAENEMNSIFEKYSKQITNKQNILQLKNELSIIGMDTLLPENLDKLNFGEE